MVSIRGRVIEQISEDADEHTDRLAKKYLGMDILLFPNEKESFQKINPEKVFIYNHPE